MRPPSARAVRVLGAAALVFIAGPLAGCGALFGSRYDNFRAYYNTFYNARRAFDQGERALRRPDQRIDRGRFLPLFPTTQVGATAAPVAAGAGSPFQQAIDKSADLLRERPGSRYADDALLLIGKSYFYSGNFVGAEQKFRETIDAATTGQQRELHDEARFWLGRTLAAQRRFDEGASVLEAALSDPEGTAAWRPEMRLALGALHADARRWDEAAAALEAALAEGGLSSDLAARGHFLRAQVLEAGGRSGEAAEAYGRVLRMRPPYELAYAAQLSRALALGLDSDQVELALDELRGMRRDGKHFANRAEIELAYARVLAASGQEAQAGERFRAVLYDRTLQGAPVRGEALFRYAEYHRDVGDDLVEASAYFDSAAAVARTEPGREELVTSAAIVGARRTADVYGSYARLAERLAEADSLLALGALDEQAFQARVQAIEADRLVTWREEQRRRARERAASGFGEVALTEGPSTGVPGSGRPEEGDPPAASPGDPPTAPVLASGFLNYLDISRVQATQLAFERVWGVRPLVANWRRREAIGGAMATGPGLDATTGPEGAVDLDRPPPLDVAAVPRTPEAQSAMRLERAGLRYEIGNVLFLSIADAESAAEWYRLVIDEDPTSAVAVRALYALAEVENSRGRQAEAQALYRRVLDAGVDGDLSAQARERLGISMEPAAAAGEAIAADSAYARGRGMWLAGQYAVAVGDLLTLAEAYPETPAAPRALLGAGVAYTEWSLRDTLPLDAIPDSLVPRSLVDAAPADSLAGRAPDIAPAVRDTIASPEDSLRDAAGEPVPIDTSSVDEPRSAGDSLAAPAPRPVPSGPAFGVVDLYTVLIERYPGTPYADRAAALRAAMTQDEGAVTADDSVAGAPTPPRPGEGARPTAATSGLMGDAAIDPAQRGFTWRVARVPTGLAARALLRNFQRRGFRTAATVDVDDEGQPVYSVIVGQFTSLEDAESVRGGLPVTGLGAELEILPLETLVLVDETQLLAEPTTPGAQRD